MEFLFRYEARVFFVMMSEGPLSFTFLVIFAICSFTCLFPGLQRDPAEGVEWSFAFHYEARFFVIRPPLRSGAEDLSKGPPFRASASLRQLPVICRQPMRKLHL